MIPQLSVDDFSLESEEPVAIKMPADKNFEEQDVDAQLFSYVISAEKGSGIHAIADLDDKWVHAHFPDLNTIEELRDAIKSDLARQNALDRGDLKFQRCADVLVQRLQGDIPDDVLKAQAKAERNRYAERLAAEGMSKQSYMQQENMSESEFETKLLDDVSFQLKLNMALDLLVQARGISVTNDELTRYLTVDDPDTFLDEAESTGKLDEARTAAARVKAMRSVIDEAVVEVE